ncbi:MAG: hypothetical protein V1869_00355 [Candidatus Omnitrophota bacterium]
MMLINIIGIFVMAMGVIILLSPKIARKMMVFWRQGKNIYIGGLIRITLGSIFIYYAPQAKLPQILLVLGLLAFLGGLLIFILGLDKAKAIIGRWEKMPDNFLRLLSLAVFTFGALILYSA